MRVLAILAAISVCRPLLSSDLASHVDPFVGTAGTANCFPNACVPHGIVQPGPSSGTGAWKYCSGYQVGDEMLYGFVQDALSGTGCADLGDLLIQPFVDEGEDAEYRATKADEAARPGYYTVTYPRQKIRCEGTCAEHTSLWRFVYPDGRSPHLLVDFQWGHAGKGALARRVQACDIEFPDDRTVRGRVRIRQWVERDCYFCMKFNRSVKANKIAPRVKGKGDRYVLDIGFDPATGRDLAVKIGLSATSVEAAIKNLTAEIPHWSFDSVAAEARQKWNDYFSRLRIEGSPEQKKTFYTAMWHLGIAPNNIADVGQPPFYSTLSFWDTFRAAHPLFTIIQPERVPDMVDSALRYYDEQGFLPIWAFWGKDNQCMIGTHSVPMIVDAYLKDLWPSSNLKQSNNSNNQTILQAYARIKETLTKRHVRRKKENWDLYDKYGYYPFDLIKGESVSRTLECAYDDWCAGVMAERLGHKEDAASFFKRASYWKNVFDPSIGMVRGKDSQGNWRTPFDPFALGHGADRANDFTEGNAFQYTWHVMQDVHGLVAAMGGREPFVKRLDALFEAPEKTAGMGEVLDVTGLIGQYVHGNEPSHHVLYFYPQVGHPEKAAERIREVCDKFYRNAPDGLSGNDDCGQMSAWYLFSAMGFYPFNPCGGEYVIGAPQVPKVVLRLPTQTIKQSKHSNNFTVIAKNLSKENKYVKSVTLNGKLVTDWKIHHADILKGGELVFEMEKRGLE